MVQLRAIAADGFQSMVKSWVGEAAQFQTMVNGPAHEAVGQQLMAAHVAAGFQPELSQIAFSQPLESHTSVGFQPEWAHVATLLHPVSAHAATGYQLLRTHVTA